MRTRHVQDLPDSRRALSLDPRQEKAQQIDVVQESLTAFKASPPTPTVASPTVCRRKAAALHVLQGICHDAVGGG